MTKEKFVSELTADEILEALEKGRKKAAEILEKSVQDPDYLKDAYKVVLRCVDHAEDNFSLEGYAHRNDIYSNKKEKISEGSLRKLFLSAVEAVECLEGIEPKFEELHRESKSSYMMIGCGTDRHIKLIKAASVFLTDGKHDKPDYNIQHIIQTYRGQRPACAAE